MLARTASLPAIVAAAAAANASTSAGSAGASRLSRAVTASKGVGGARQDVLLKYRDSIVSVHRRGASSSSRPGRKDNDAIGASDKDTASSASQGSSEGAQSPGAASASAPPTQSLRRGVDMAGQGQQQLAAAAAAEAAATAAAAASVGSSPTPAQTSQPSSGSTSKAWTTSSSTPPTRPLAQPYQHRRKADTSPSSGSSVPRQDASTGGSASPSSSPDLINATILTPGDAAHSRSAAHNAASPGQGSDADQVGSGSLPSAALTLTTTPTTEDDAFRQRRRQIKHPFNTFALVHRLRLAGFQHTPRAKGKERQTDSDGQAIIETSADVVMDATRKLLVKRGEWILENHLNKGDLENEAYLFSAALAELRTETQVRARNDGAALRSMTTLLQREVDALDLKMREDISMLKHDIQIEMNTRKAELKEGQNSLEQEIQDLNNRFTISLSDLKTEIEQNIKWDATRRSLALVFGIAAIVMTTLTLADILTRDEQAAAALAKGAKASAAGSSPPSGSKVEDEAARAAREAGMNLRAEASEGSDTLTDSLAGATISPPQSAEELGLLPRYDLEAMRVI